MQLHDLRHHPFIKFFAYAGFGLIIISFIFFYGWSTPSKSDAGTPDAAVAQYRSNSALSFLPWRRYETIPLHEVRQARGALINEKLSSLPPQFIQFLQQRGGSYDWLATNDEAIQKAMDMRLLREEATRLGLVVTRQEVEDFIRAQYKDPKDLARLDQELASQGRTIEDLIEDLHDQQLALRAANFISNEAQVSLYDLWQEYSLVHEKIKLKLAAYPVSSFLKEVNVTDADLQAYLNEHIEEYRVPAKRRYEYVRVSEDEIKKTVEATPEKVQEFYDKDSSLFKKPDSVKVEHLFAPIKENEQPTTASLAMINKAYEQVKTRPLSHDLAAEIDAQFPPYRSYFQEVGWIERNPDTEKNYGPAYLNRAFALTDDRISTPVLGKNGYYLIHALEQKAGVIPPLNEIQPQVEEKYKQHKAEEIFKERLNAAKEQRKRYNAVRDMATDLKLEDSITSLVAVTDFNIQGIGSLGEHRNYIPSLKKNQPSQVIPMPLSNPTSFVVLEVIQEEPSRLPELAEVKGQVDMAYRQAKAKDIARAAAENANQQVTSGQAFELAAATAPKPPVESDPFTRSEPVKTLGAPLINFSKQTSRIAKGSIGVTPYGNDKDSPEGYAVWEVIDVEPPAQEKFKEDRATFTQQYLQLVQRTMVEEWLADKRKEVGYKLLGRSEKS